MSLRRCWRFSGLVPRLLWSRAVLPAPSAAEERRCLPAFLNTGPGYRTSQLLLRTFSAGPSSTEVNYDQLKRLLADRRSVVIDVREPWELREYGVIPGSINVPLGQVSAALQLCSEEFKEKYGAEPPQQTDAVVFSCLAGIRMLSIFRVDGKNGRKMKSIIDQQKTNT
ncbi:thiosulfate sulfurtransferase/rhodanese-like domain-containing protein 3 isoform X2 [Brachionichthys hirsutus]|uniref:thiosulfate sulfurtransferase/rhodanese-like domain-containing protein 3 isoform X2 n=1 Tax=Brachionichthys hirsutus TaxID=412623 RepID=UPI0036049934